MSSKKNNKKDNHKKGELNRWSLSARARAYFWGIAFLLLAVILLLSFFKLAGTGGEKISAALSFLLGQGVFLLPLFLVLEGTIILVAAENFYHVWPLAALSGALLVLGLGGILYSFSPPLKFLPFDTNSGGFLGYLISFPVLKIFGQWVNFLVFGGVISFAFLVLRQINQGTRKFETEELEKKPSLIREIIFPRLKMKETSQERGAFQKSSFTQALPELKTRPLGRGGRASVYKTPPLDLLEEDHGSPTTGDIRANMAIIKKTLENFAIIVEMSEVNVGPTVTQYTLKPSEGVKLSKITSLSNDLSLALASHPIRIEAPIPGRPLVGVEVPNKTRIHVRVRNLFGLPEFQQSSSQLLFSLGRDVAGNPCFADLARMPHLLVAGATGTGKTICLNNIILGLLYRNSPEILRLVLIDPKRVEFPVYQDLPHLLTPVIFDSQKTVIVLRWLIGEMERRFEVLASARARDIASYNRDIVVKQAKNLSEELELMPYIVVIIDELADLMASRGKEVEVAIVRLAQMARAVGIHLVVATQRPSVEVITGLIKANITSRISFQVASQVDSRTVLDVAGAEKLLGGGDLLFISAETSRPKRIQGAYVSDKEVKKVTEFLKQGLEKTGLAAETFSIEDFEKELTNRPETKGGEIFLGGEDPLYAQAKQIIIEAKKASASLLQRRLRLGYARAARMLDVLEERGVVGPADGAKPREVYIHQIENSISETEEQEKEEEKKEEKKDDGWEKV